MKNNVVANLYKYELYPFVRQNWIDVLNRSFNARLYSPSNQEEYIEIVNSLNDSIVFESNHFSFLYPNILIKGRNNNKFVHFFTDDDQYFYPFSRYFSLYYHLSLYTYSNIFQEKLYEKHGLNAKLVPYGGNPNIFYPIEIDKIYDVIFIGSSHIPQRIELIRFLKNSGINVRVYGSGWGEFNEFADINGGFVKDEDIAKIYSSAKIVINFLGTLENKCILKGKVFETAMCQTFQVVEECEEVKFWMKDKESIVFYNTKDHLLKIINYYLKNTKEREKIAKNSYEIAKKNDWNNIFENSFKDLANYHNIPYYTILNKIKNTKIYLLDLDNMKYDYYDDLMVNITVIQNKDVQQFLDNIKNINEKFYISFIQKDVITHREKLFFQVYSLINDEEDHININISSYDLVVKKKFIYKIDFHHMKNSDNLIDFIIPSSLMVNSDLIKSLNFTNINSLKDIYSEVCLKIKNKDENFRYISLGRELIVIKKLILIFTYIPVKKILSKTIKKVFK